MSFLAALGGIAALGKAAERMAAVAEKVFDEVEAARERELGHLRVETANQKALIERLQERLAVYEKRNQEPGTGGQDSGPL